MARPTTRYVAVDDADVAYQVVGEGPRDLVFFWGLGSQVELQWDHPAYSRFLERLASFSRLILFDRRGTGASDGVPGDAPPTWEAWVEDISAVMDAAESESATIVALTDAGPMAMVFAAMHPARVDALVLAGTSARLLVADDYPVGHSAETIDAIVRFIGEHWARPELLGASQPDGAGDPGFLAWWTKMTATAATPRAAAAQYRRLFAADVRSVLPMIQAPTLVLHSEGHPFVPVDQARYVAERIPTATLMVLPGGFIGVDVLNPDQPVLTEVEAFVTGQRPAPEPDRVLTTVLFTDIVGSTQRAAQLGDRRWRSLLDSHDATVREQLTRFRGREVKQTGDGFFASFDGPARAIRCGQAITNATAALGVEVRAGLHTGECEVRGDDLGGLAVHIAARVGALAQPGEVLVSRTVTDLVAGSGIVFADHGEHELKGVPGRWRLFAAEA